MGDDPRNLPLFPSVIFIVAPILGITGLLCWATIQNRRGFGIRIPNRPTDQGKLLSDEDRPGLYEIWVENNLKSLHKGHEGRDHPVQITDPHGELGDPRSLCNLIQRPLALKPEALSNGHSAGELNTLATLIRMPQHAEPIGKTINEVAVHDPEVEVLIGTSPIRITAAGDSSKRRHEDGR